MNNEEKETRATDKSKKQKIIKIVISAIIVIAIMCLEFFGLKSLKDTEILICNSNQSIDIKEEMENITGALPSTGTYSVKVVTRNNEGIHIYYMYDGQMNDYEFTYGASNIGSGLSHYLSTDAIDGNIVYYTIIIGTAILLAILITYLFISKNPMKGITKVGYFILAISVLVFLLCIIPMLSKNHGGDIYYYSIVIGSFLIGLLYGYKNKIFFLPTIFMFPIYLVAIWFNYRSGILWPDDFGAFVFLNFIGALTGKILEKNKGMKKKHIIFYIIITVLLFIGRFAGKIKPRTATALISDCCELSLHGIAFSLIVYIIYIVIKKIKSNIVKNKITPTLNEKVTIELIIVIILTVFTIGSNIYYLKPHNYVEAILQPPSTTIAEQYSYHIIENKVYVTTDFGRNWIEVPAELSNIYSTDREFVSDSYYIGINKLIFETSNGDFISLIYSDDGGASWKNGMVTDTSGYIIYMNFFNQNDGIAMICYGNEIGQREHIRASVTYDGGKTWTTRKADSSSVRINRGAEIEFTSVKEGKIENISYDGSKTVYVTEDGGLTWTVE